MHFERSVLAAAVLACSACSFNGVQEQAQVLPLAERAYIAGKYTVDCYHSPMERYKGECVNTAGSVVLRFAHERGGEGALSNRAVRHDTFDPDAAERGYSFCIPVLPGRYMLTRFTYFDNFPGTAGYDMPIGIEGRFGLPFEATEATITHLGELKLASKRTWNLFGIVTFVPDELELRPQGDKEMAALSKCPDEARHLEVRRRPIVAVEGKRHPRVRIVAPASP